MQVVNDVPYELEVPLWYRIRHYCLLKAHIGKELYVVTLGQQLPDYVDHFFVDVHRGIVYEKVQNCLDEILVDYERFLREAAPMLRH